MESLLLAIAMLCQLNGDGQIWAKENAQKSCQKELAKCALSEGWNGASNKKVMECLRDRK